MARTLLVRGMLVGLVAGVLAFGFASLFGESPIDQAIAFEGAHVHGADGPELVSRAVQSTFGLLVAVGAVLVGRASAARLARWNAVLLGVGTFVAVVAVAGLVLPRIDEVAGDFPATVLWRFRLASVGTQLVLWTTFGLLFGALTERSLRRRAAAAHVVPAG